MAQEHWIELVKIIASVVTAIAAVAGVCIAWRGLNRWRVETIGKRKAELAEEVLADFYQARDIMNEVRSTILLLSEGATRQKADWEKDEDTKTLNAYYAPIERLKNNREFFDQLQARRYRFMALFRKQAREQVAKPYDDLFKIQVDVRSAAETLIENYRDYINKTPVYGWCEWQVAIRRRGKDDPISKELDRIVVAIETICRPAIQEAASKNQAP